MGQELEEKGYGKKGYTDLIFERESYVSTIYTNGVCIPHPLETDALKKYDFCSYFKETLCTKWQRNKNSFYDLFKERSS